MTLSPHRKTLEIRAVSKAFDGTSVFSELSFAIEEECVTALLGQSGCGKTTLLNIIAGILEPDEGKILLHDNDITASPGRISYMQQDDLMLPWKKTIDNIALPLVVKGMTMQKARARALPYLPLFGLAAHAHAYPWELSGGMRQRAALLRTYLGSDTCIILDEPFGALDVVTRDTMQQWLLSVVDELKPSVLFVTHDVLEALVLADTIVVMGGCPAKITDTIANPIPRSARKEHLHSPEFTALRQRIWDAL